MLYRISCPVNHTTHIDFINTTFINKKPAFLVRKRVFELEVNSLCQHRILFADGIPTADAINHGKGNQHINTIAYWGAGTD